MLILHPPANLGSLGDLGSLDNLCLRLHHLVLDILGGRDLDNLDYPDDLDNLGNLLNTRRRQLRLTMDCFRNYQNIVYPADQLHNNIAEYQR